MQTSTLKVFDSFNKRAVTRKANEHKRARTGIKSRIWATEKVGIDIERRAVVCGTNEMLFYNTRQSQVAFMTIVWENIGAFRPLNCRNHHNRIVSVAMKFK